MLAYFKSVGNYVAHTALPHAADALFHHNVKMGGLCLCLGTAALFKIAKERFMRAPNAPPLTNRRIILEVAYGGTLVAYGLFQLFYEVLFQEEPETRLNKSIGKVKDCPQTNDLWKKANEKGKIFFVLGPAKTGGKWDERNRTIILDPQMRENNMLSTAIFELCNANRPKSPDFHAFRQRTEAGEIGRMEFMKTKMRWEWPSLNCHHQAVKPCLASQGWDSEIDMYRDELSKNPSFDAFWKDYQIQPSHQNHRQNLVDLWNKYFKNVYCQKHPNSLDCF